MGKSVILRLAGLEGMGDLFSVPRFEHAQANVRWSPFLKPLTGWPPHIPSIIIDQIIQET